MKTIDRNAKPCQMNVPCKKMFCAFTIKHEKKKKRNCERKVQQQQQHKLEKINVNIAERTRT